MKKLFLMNFAILFLGIVVQSQVFIESKTIKDEYGNTEQYSFYRNAAGNEVKQGKYVEHLANGTKILEMFYQNGKCNGLQTYFFFENGNKEAEGGCYNDVLTGLWTKWYLNGKKAEECPYKNDSENGVCKFWSETGEFIEEVKYIDGKPAAFVEWEKRNVRTAFLYPNIVVRLDKLEFSSEYSKIKKEFQLSELENLIDSLPKTVWNGGRIISIQGTGQRNQADYKKMFELMGEIDIRIKAKGFRVLSSPCC